MLRILGGVTLTVGGLTLACATPPTGVDEADAGPILLGRGNDNGARIWLPTYDFCAVVDGVGALVPVPCPMDVGTPSPNSVATVVAQASGVSNPTGTTVHWGPANPGYMWAGLFYQVFGLTAPPYPCGVIVGNGEVRFTLDWDAIVTPSGQATVTCHYSDTQAYQFPL